jgi:hypothetical protein
MSQHDLVIDNQSAPASRADINSALQALGTLSSGTTSPATTYANMLWYDTSTDLLKMRNEANSAWITLGTIDQTNNVFNPNFLPATQAEAEAGTDNIKGMTPLRVSQEITAKVGVANAATVKTAINAGGSAPIYACRAWVNFGSTGTIRASGNVTSITVGTTGIYTLNFTTAIQDTNYVVTGCTQRGATGGNDGMVVPDQANMTTTSAKISTVNGGGGFATGNCYVAVFR